ncbi:MAG: peptidyl-tRNA hydrolase Pth2 [Candidatus Altiarchaeota archaeon]|nr:peptidyl-tRNA hydrolase Pth2 [Candidatus Altiarchaeota archaeon]
MSFLKRAAARDELKQVIAVRTDLEMGKGKIAAQVAHAAVSAADRSEWKSDWLAQGGQKTVVKVGGEKELIEVFMHAKKAGLPAALIEDAGHTQIPAGTKTCVGIGPAPEAELDKVTGKLKLL